MDLVGLLDLVVVVAGDSLCASMHASVSASIVKRTGFLTAGCFVIPMISSDSVLGFFLFGYWFGAIIGLFVCKVL